MADIEPGMTAITCWQIPHRILDADEPVLLRMWAIPEDQAGDVVAWLTERFGPVADEGLSSVGALVTAGNTQAGFIAFTGGPGA